MLQLGLEGIVEFMAGEFDNFHNDNTFVINAACDYVDDISCFLKVRSTS
jgi:hypothetical protein